VRRRPHLLAASLSVLSLTAQTAPTLAVDANANRHPISPYIYGINEWSDNGLFQMMHIPVLRWGGDDATSYNWQTSTKNNTGDNPWCYENYSVSPDFDQFHTANLSAGTISLGTIPLMDWSPKDAGECSFSVTKYGKQKSTNPDNADCGNGFLVNGDQVKNDPNDAYVPVTQSLSQQWIQHIMTTYGPANAGGVRLWSMDNEPEWWYANHMDVYPQPATYNDMMARNLKWAGGEIHGSHRAGHRARARRLVGHAIFERRHDQRMADVALPILGQPHRPECARRHPLGSLLPAADEPVRASQWRPPGRLPRRACVYHPGKPQQLRG
jgi:hypothetical protein